MHVWPDTKLPALCGLPRRRSNRSVSPHRLATPMPTTVSPDPPGSTLSWPTRRGNHLVTHGAQILLNLTSHDAQSAAQLIQASTFSPAETLEQLQRLLDQGFIILVGPTDLRVYQLVPKHIPLAHGVLQDRILLVEDDLLVQSLVVEVLEDEGYAVIATLIPAEAVAILAHVGFDLVITDSFGQVPAAVFSSTKAVLEQAGATPVALFTAHPVRFEDAQLVGFRAVVAKPFDLVTMLHHVRVLLDL
jgi:CheY-like chemotaxis protein